LLDFVRPITAPSDAGGVEPDIESPVFKIAAQLQSQIGPVFPCIRQEDGRYWLAALG